MVIVAVHFKYIYIYIYSFIFPIKYGFLPFLSHAVLAILYYYYLLFYTFLFVCRVIDYYTTDADVDAGANANANVNAIILL